MPAMYYTDIVVGCFLKGVGLMSLATAGGAGAVRLPAVCRWLPAVQQEAEHMKAEWQLAWRRFAVMLMKELKQLGRDRVLLAFYRVCFTADIFLAASGVSLSLNHAATLVQDLDHSPQSANCSPLPAALFPYRRYGAAGCCRAGCAGSGPRHAGAVGAAAVWPGSGQWPAHQPGHAGGYHQFGTGVSGYQPSQQIVSQYGLESAMQRLGVGQRVLAGLPQVQNDIRVWYNPNQEDSWFMGISEMLNIATVFAVLLPAAAMVRERAWHGGAVDRVAVIPVWHLAAQGGVDDRGDSVRCGAQPVPGADSAVCHSGEGQPAACFALSGLYVFTTAGWGCLPPPLRAIWRRRACCRF
jgi:ABC-2 type transport system permease protein